METTLKKLNWGDRFKIDPKYDNYYYILRNKNPQTKRYTCEAYHETKGRWTWLDRHYKSSQKVFKV